MIEAAGSELAYLVAVQLQLVTEPAVNPGTGLGGLEEDLGCELVPALVSPAPSRRTAIGRRVLQLSAEERFDLQSPRIFIPYVRKLRWERGDPFLGQESLQGSSGRRARRYTSRILLR